VPETYGEAKTLCNRMDVNWEMTSGSRYKIFEYILKDIELNQKTWLKWCGM
jgi:hypothetical protein